MVQDRSLGSSEVSERLAQGGRKGQEATDQVPHSQRTSNFDPEATLMRLMYIQGDELMERREVTDHQVETFVLLPDPIPGSKIGINVKFTC